MSSMIIIISSLFQKLRKCHRTNLLICLLNIPDALEVSALIEGSDSAIFTYLPHASPRHFKVKLKLHICTEIRISEIHFCQALANGFLENQLLSY